jgi:hypothetical protein
MSLLEGGVGGAWRQREVEDYNQWKLMIIMMIMIITMMEDYFSHSEIIHLVFSW